MDAPNAASPAGPRPYGGSELCGDPRSCSDTHVVLVWPAHAAQILFYIVAIGLLVLIGWYYLRAGFCWRCGRETGLCRHTRYDEPKSPNDAGA